MDAKQLFNKVMDELITSTKPCQFYYKNGIYHNILGVYQQMVKDKSWCPCCNTNNKHQMKPDELTIKEVNDIDSKDEDGDFIYYAKYDVSSRYTGDMTVLMVDDTVNNLMNVLCSDTVFEYFCMENEVDDEIVCLSLCDELKECFLGDYHDNFYFTGDKGKDCSVCLEKYNKKGRKKTEFSCGHCVCKGCYNTIMECDKPKCPICRNLVNDADIVLDFFKSWIEDNSYCDAVDKKDRYKVIITYLKAQKNIDFFELKCCDRIKVLMVLFNCKFAFLEERNNMRFIFTERF